MTDEEELALEETREAELVAALKASARAPKTEKPKARTIKSLQRENEALKKELADRDAYISAAHRRFAEFEAWVGANRSAYS